MTLEQARAILGDRAKWELTNMIKALSMFPFLNSDEDNQRLKAARIMRRSKK